MRKRSLQKQATMVMVVLVVFFIALFIGFGYTYFRTNNAQYLRDLQIGANQSKNSLNRDLLQASTQVGRYFSESTYYRKIVSGKIPDYEWAKGVYHIKTDLTTQAATLPFSGGYFFFDRNRDRFFSSYHNYNDSTLILNGFLKDVAREMYTNRLYYGYERFQDSVFLVYYLSLNGNPLGYVLDLTNYLHVEEGMQTAFVLRDADQEDHDILLTTLGSELLSQEEIVALVSAGEKQDSYRGNLTTVAEITEFPNLYMLTVSNARSNSIWRQKSFWAFLILLPVAFTYIYVYFIRMLKRTLLNPVTHLYSRLKQTQKQDGVSLSDETEQIEEYQEINEQIDGMTQQITVLREGRLKEQLRTNEALLQYYQLQTNPHFFLSCLNTVSSLLECGRVEMADNLIRALSSHFRYIFRASMTLVTLGEELKAVQDFCDISQIRSGFPILLTCEVSEEAKAFPIPLLSVMTFVENSVKHFGNPNKILTILIQAALRDENGARSIDLRITDNGRGYTEESLRESNAPVDSYDFIPNHVGIRNLKYRMRLLYGEKAEWRFYNAPAGAAVAELKLAEVSDERSDS